VTEALASRCALPLPGESTDAPRVRRATAPVRSGARGRDLIASLRDAGLLELAYGVVFAAATVIITL